VAGNDTPGVRSWMAVVVTLAATGGPSGMPTNSRASNVAALPDDGLGVPGRDVVAGRERLIGCRRGVEVIGRWPACLRSSSSARTCRRAYHGRDAGGLMCSSVASR